MSITIYQDIHEKMNAIIFSVRELLIRNNVYYISDQEYNIYRILRFRTLSHLPSSQLQ